MKNTEKTEVTVTESAAQPSPDAVKETATEEVKIAKKKRRRKKLHEIDAENDIKFRGPFSYRHLRIFAWIFLAMAQIATMLSVAGKIDGEWYEGIRWLASVLSFFGNLTLPLFLLAAFSIILNAKDGYKSIIIMYAAGFVGVILAYIFVYHHYILGLLTKIIKDRGEVRSSAQVLLQIISGSGFIAINIFADLLLCTLFTFFINYHPTKYFQGKKIIIFRLFALLPIIYELVSIVLKILAVSGKITLSFYLYPFLTTKPPAMFLMFLALAVFIKIRERIYRKRGKTLAEYKKFLKTNANSLHFSVYACIIAIITVIIDVIVLVIVTSVLFNEAGGGDAVELLEAFSSALKLGFGESVVLIFAIPFIMLFSYTKTYKDKMVDRVIPLGGVGLLVAVYIEGVFQLICALM